MVWIISINASGRNEEISRQPIQAGSVEHIFSLTGVLDQLDPIDQCGPDLLVGCSRGNRVDLTRDLCLAPTL